MNLRHSNKLSKQKYDMAKRASKSNSERTQKYYKRPVYVFNEKEDYVKTYDSLTDCSEDLGFNNFTLTSYIKQQRLVNGMYFSYGKTFLKN